MLGQPKTLDEVKQYVLGEWTSLSVELRPTEDRTGTGSVTPTYLKRNFQYLPGNTFVGVITMYGDNYGNIPFLEFEFKGRLHWGEAHPVADGAWMIDYILSDGFNVTPMHDNAVAILNQDRPETFEPFSVNNKSNILQKAFPLFNIREGEIVSDYDLIYFDHGLLFMGAKHVNGTPFDQAERRPHQLQIPLKRSGT